MKKNNLKPIFTIALAFLLLVSAQSVAHADATKLTDTSGSITGTAGGTYYQVSSWSDVNQAYSTDNGTSVYVQAQTDFYPDVKLGLSNQYNIVSGKNLIIDGNNKTLNLSSNSTSSTGQNYAFKGGANHAFSDSQSLTSTTDRFTLKNATLINNVTNGLFQINGLANITYDNVTVTNSDKAYNARPFFNWSGSITLTGTTQFNIIAGASKVIAGNGPQKIQDQGYTAKSGNPSNGEWLRGSASVDVYDTSTLNYNWYIDQPYNSANSTTPLNITVHTNAKLYWNINNAFAIDYSKAPLDWKIGNNAAFIISGSQNTFSTGRSNLTNKFDLSLGDNATFSSAFAAGINNLNSLITGSNAKINIQNIFAGNAISSGYNSKSSMALSDSTDATFTSIDTNVLGTSMSISLLGSGLITNASKNSIPDVSSNSFTKDVISGTFTSGFTTSLFTSAEQSILKSAKYIHWYPIKAEFGFSSNTADRSFHITSDMLTHDQKFSLPINGDAAMTFGIHNSASTTPSLSLSVQLTKNNTPNITQYVWRNIDGSTTAPLSNTPLVIATISPKNNLSSNITKSTSKLGSDYRITFNNNQGLLLQSKNTIQSGTSQNATMTYKITNGPN